jgi:plasmid rolling circle replication initiator protein Rep
MFNPTNLVGVCVQETHLEARGKNTPQEGSNKPFYNGDKIKRKFKGKEKIMLQSRKREKKSHVNTIQRRP